MNEFKFFLVTDTHFFKNSLGAYGPGYDELMETEQKCYAETEAMNRALFAWLEDNHDAETILFAGDLSFNGEKESHEEFSKMLKHLQDSGKKLYVVTAAHDIAGDPFCYKGGEREKVEGIKFDDLYDYYHEFGYDNAIAFNREHMSYVAQLEEGVRLLVLCNDTAQGHSLEYDDEFLKWVTEQCKAAQNDGQIMFAMEHYPVLAGQPILNLIGDARQKGAQKLVDTLADNGVHLIFTGHMHNQSINETKSSNGNVFYDVCTGSAIGCPAFIRICNLSDDGNIDIKSIPVPDFEWDTKGKTCKQYLQDLFDNMIRGYVIGLRDTPEKTLRKIGVKDPSKAVVKIAAKAGKFLSKATLGKLGHLLCVKVEPEIKNVLFVDLAVNLVRYAFCGDQPYTDQTPEGKTLLRVFAKVAKIMKRFGKTLKGSQGEEIDIYETLKHTAGNYGICDDHAILNIK